MLSLALCVLVAAAPTDSEALIGKVRLTRAVGGPKVTLVSGGTTVSVKGDLKSEIAKLQAAKVELIGRREGDTFVVHEYRILDIGGGIKPMVGILVPTAAGLGLSDGDGEPIPLSLNPRGKLRLQKMPGAKIWISGKRLVSGELKVLRYGILREPPKSTGKEAP